MNVYIWTELQAKWEYVSETYNATGTNTSNYFGVVFTAKGDCQIEKVKFLGGEAIAGDMRIGKGTFWNNLTNTEDYSITGLNNPDGVYTLSTPYQLSAGDTFAVFVKPGFSWKYVDVNANNYPVEGDYVKYIYGTNNGGTSQINYVPIISGLYLN